MRRMLRTLFIVAATLALIVILALAHRAAGLPSVRALHAYLTDQQTELPPQQCIPTPLIVAATATALKLEPALVAAEGQDTSAAQALFGRSTARHGHYSYQISRTLLCGDTHRHLGWTLDNLIVATEVDMSFSAHERHVIYLNRAYFGEGQYGVADASNHYFSKPPEQLTLAESALLVALPNRPMYLSPYRHPDHAVARRNMVLAEMQRQGSISPEAARAAQAAPLFSAIR